MTLSGLVKGLARELSPFHAFDLLFELYEREDFAKYLSTPSVPYTYAKLLVAPMVAAAYAASYFDSPVVAPAIVGGVGYTLALVGGIYNLEKIGNKELPTSE